MGKLRVTGGPRRGSGYYFNVADIRSIEDERLEDIREIILPLQVRVVYREVLQDLGVDVGGHCLVGINDVPIRLLHILLQQLIIRLRLEQIEQILCDLKRIPDGDGPDGPPHPVG